MSETVAAQPRKRRPLRALWLIFVNTLAFLLLIEIVTRIIVTRVRPAAAGSERSGPPEENVGYGLHPYFQMVNPPGPEVDQGPDYAGWRIYPPQAQYDQGRYRIMFLGGSTTNNYYPTMVRDILAEVCECEIPPATAYILAYPWQTSLHSLCKFWTYCDQIEPDLVIVLDNINDLRRSFTTPGESLPQYRSDYSHSSGAFSSFWITGRSGFENVPAFYARHNRNYDINQITDQDDLSTLARDVIEHSSLLRLLRHNATITPLSGREQVPMEPEVYLRCLPDFERNLQNLSVSCRAKNVPVLFLTMPFTTKSTHNFLLPSPALTNDGRTFLSDADFEKAMSRMNEAVVALRDEPYAHVFDLAPFIRDPALFEDEVHLDDKGQELEARLVVRYILFKIIGCK